MIWFWSVYKCFVWFPPPLGYWVTYQSSAFLAWFFVWACKWSILWEYQKLEIDGLFNIFFQQIPFDVFQTSSHVIIKIICYFCDWFFQGIVYCSSKIIFSWKLSWLFWASVLIVKFANLLTFWSVFILLTWIFGFCFNLFILVCIFYWSFCSWRKC